MTIVVKLANNETNVFESQSYTISKTSDFHPMILGVTIYSDGKRIVTASRPFRGFFYKHFTFKTKKVQDELKRIDDAEKMKKIAEEAKKEKISKKQ